MDAMTTAKVEAIFEIMELWRTGTVVNQRRELWDEIKAKHGLSPAAAPEKSNPCPHREWVYTPNPSGNNDTSHACTSCGKELTPAERANSTEKRETFAVPGHTYAAQGGKERWWRWWGYTLKIDANGDPKWSDGLESWSARPMTADKASQTAQANPKFCWELDPSTGQPLAPPPAPAWPRWFALDNDHRNGTHGVWRMTSQTEGRYWLFGQDDRASAYTVAELESNRNVIELTEATCAALAEVRRAAPEQPRDAMEERAKDAWMSHEYRLLPGPVCMVKFAKAERTADAATIAALTEERDGLRVEVDRLMTSRVPKPSKPQIRSNSKKKSPRRGGAKKGKVKR